MNQGQEAKAPLRFLSYHKKTLVAREVHPLNDEQAAALLAAAKDTNVEYLLAVALFTGLRQSELLGLTWDAIDFTAGVIRVNKQLARAAYRTEGPFQSPKSGKARTITPAPAVMAALRKQRARQSETQLKAGPFWDNPYGLVFTTETGAPFNQRRADNGFHKALAAAGLSGFHFHSLRHTYAVNALRAGEDIKTVQANLGHATAAFTLDKYGHFTEQMARDSAARMERFIKGVLNL